jgi:hypothetical protein
MQAQHTYAGYDYGLVDNPDGTSTVTCFPSDNTRCIVVRVPKTEAMSAGFFSPKRDSDFHDKGLQQATKKINEILASVSKRSKEEHLHLLLTERGPMLAWVHMTVETVSIDGM